MSDCILQSHSRIRSFLNYELGVVFEDSFTSNDAHEKMKSSRHCIPQPFILILESFEDFDKFYPILSSFLILQHCNLLLKHLFFDISQNLMPLDHKNTFLHVHHLFLLTSLLDSFNPIIDIFSNPHLLLRTNRNPLAFRYARFIDSLLFIIHNKYPGNLIIDFVLQLVKFESFLLNLRVLDDIFELTLGVERS